MAPPDPFAAYLARIESVLAELPPAQSAAVQQLLLGLAQFAEGLLAGALAMTEVERAARLKSEQSADYWFEQWLKVKQESQQDLSADREWMIERVKQARAAYEDRLEMRQPVLTAETWEKLTAREEA